MAATQNLAENTKAARLCERLVENASPSKSLDNGDKKTRRSPRSEKSLAQVFRVQLLAALTRARRRLQIAREDFESRRKALDQAFEGIFKLRKDQVTLGRREETLLKQALWKLDPEANSFSFFPNFEHSMWLGRSDSPTRSTVSESPFVAAAKKLLKGQAGGAEAIDQQLRADTMRDVAVAFATARPREELEIWLMDGAGRIVALFTEELLRRGLFTKCRNGSRGHFKCVKVVDVNYGMVEYHKIVFPQCIFGHHHGNVFDELTALDNARLSRVFFYGNFSAIQGEVQPQGSNCFAIAAHFNRIRQLSKVPPVGVSWSLGHGAESSWRLKCIAEYAAAKAAHENVAPILRGGTYKSYFFPAQNNSAAYPSDCVVQEGAKTKCPDCDFTTNAGEQGIKIHRARKHK